jgi:hypothetical protein
MSLYADMLDELVATAELALGIPATRDPSQVAGLVAASGCVFVGFPVIAGRLLGGPTLDVPVSLIAPAPSDLLAVNWLLEHMDTLVTFTQSTTAVNGPLDFGDLTYPAVTATARISLEV